MESELAPHPLSDRPLLAVVINPRNIDDLETLQNQVTKVSTELGWKPPL